jgi:hypothetical protein
MKGFCEAYKKQKFVSLVLVMNCESSLCRQKFKQFYSNTATKDFSPLPHFMLPLQYPPDLGENAILNVGSIALNQIGILIMSHDVLQNRNDLGILTENSMEIQ